MARKKVTTLFNKNHISIVKIENDPLSIGKLYNILGTISHRKGSLSTSTTIEKFVVKRDIYTPPQRIVPQKSKKDTVEEVRLKSPLGFYYTKRIYHNDGPKETYVGGNEHIVWFFFDKDDIRYELSYYIMNSNTRIGIETRPWEIIDNEVFEDNDIEALQTEVEKLINISKSKCSGELDDSLCKGNPGYKNIDRYFIGDLNDVKRLIFTDLFGYPDGPKHQTNKEKILSHGFDLKTSFRKM